MLEPVTIGIRNRVVFKDYFIIPHIYTRNNLIGKR